MSSGFLTTEHVYIIPEANFSILGVPVHQFACFFLKIDLKFCEDFIFLH